MENSTYKIVFEQADVEFAGQIKCRERLLMIGEMKMYSLTVYGRFHEKVQFC